MTPEWYRRPRPIVATSGRAARGRRRILREMRAAIVVVGDELLSGHVRDANGHHIAERLAVHGHRLLWMAVVPDDPAIIADAVQRALRSVDIAFVCGGVGPTHDDRTMEGVAAALGRPLERCEPIAERIEQIAGHLAREGFAGDPLGMDGLRKMAMVPQRAEVLPCSIGLIPAVTLTDDLRRIVILPGPPRELQAVFRDAVEPRFLAGTGLEVHREEIEHPFPESSVAGYLRRLVADFPEVTIGSYPMEGYSLVRLTGETGPVREAADRLRAQLREMEDSEEGRRLLGYLDRRRGGS